MSKDANFLFYAAFATNLNVNRSHFLFNAAKVLFSIFKSNLLFVYCPIFAFKSIVKISPYLCKLTNPT